MTEAFLHYIWKHQLFDRNGLVSSGGLPVEIIKPGEYNTHAGPDFFSAHLRINNTLWVGNVEIHLRASDWEKHRHGQDGAYDNCILHVVFECDAEVYRKNGEVICCLELKNRFAANAWKNYQDLLGTRGWIPCSHRVREVNKFIIDSWLDRLAVERLESKTEIILHALEQNKFDWEETFYQFLCAGFGFQINSLPFMMLARHLPFKLIQRHREKQLYLEALFFGCGGFLDEKATDFYSENLQQDFRHFRKAYSLKSMDVSCWKFLRLRPVNFPTVRIAQLAALFSSTGRLFPHVLEMIDWNSGKHLFLVEASSYWDSHYILGKESVYTRKKLGLKSIESLFINTLIPFLFAYGMRNNSDIHRQRAMDLLEQIAAEDNSIIKNWAGDGIVPASALQSQALLELRKNYCSEKKCLTCRIGIELINTLP